MAAPLPLLLALATLAGGERSSQVPGAAPSPRLAWEPGPRTEYFVLELGAEEATRDVGVACLRRREVPGGIQLEAEWLFRRSDDEGGDERVQHVETIGANGSRLVWREWGTSRARTVTAERSADRRSLAVDDAARGGREHVALASGDPILLPLELLEGLRGGNATDASWVRFDPLSRSLDRVAASADSPAIGAAPQRRIDLLREDGTIAGRFEFRGTGLLSLRWQEGDLVARSVDEERYRAMAPRPKTSRGGP